MTYFGRTKVAAAGLATAGMLCLTVGAATAEPRARLSRDLAEALASRRGEARDVILQADRATVEAVAGRHGATVKKWLQTGAVLTVDGAGLEALGADPDVDHLSGDTLVHSMMAVTDPAIGADQVWAGTLGRFGAITGRGIGIGSV
jgi:hypothetical protein